VTDVRKCVVLLYAMWCGFNVDSALRSASTAKMLTVRLQKVDEAAANTSYLCLGQATSSSQGA
jgi:hypothetical protein